MNNLDDMLRLQNWVTPPFEEKERRKSGWDLVNRSEMIMSAAWLRCSLVNKCKSIRSINKFVRKLFMARVKTTVIDIAVLKLKEKYSVKNSATAESCS